MSRTGRKASFAVLACALIVGSRLHVGAWVQSPQRPAELTPQPILQGLPEAAPVKVHDVRPVYPSAAAAAGISGPVIVTLTIDAGGHVTDAKVVKGDVTLAPAALEAVRQWQYGPISTAPAKVTVGVNVVDNRGLAATQERVRVGGQIKPPQKIKDVRPVYPAAAQNARAQGMVIAEATIDPSGVVIDAQILRSIPMLDVAALDAVLRWVFEPRPESPPVRMTVTVRFALDSKSKPGGEGGAIGGIVGGPVVGGIVESKEPVRVGSGVKQLTTTKYVAPVYPAEAKAAKIQGTVIVELVIGKDGKVERAKILRSIPELDEAALAAVRQWEFTPTLINGAPVPVVMTAAVNFKLE